MPVLIIILLAFLVAQFGFWDTFAGVLGGIGIIILVTLTAAALLVVMGAVVLKRLGRR
ncbi:MAG TPA: hypothetical protein VKZ87_10305 [Ferrovibrio sp.]|jgi:hypothetical protein|uniref:hypothetical protein n=1 Tax=Ferrovibrio sp. TaxID=1917215 RepID=UPI002B4ACF13|nr:hypothetical protein [Ferrovibrio sp.]HLT77769.1 hypothetical protein [Ferrovibrio sp.]